MPYTITVPLLWICGEWTTTSISFLIDVISHIRGDTTTLNVDIGKQSTIQKVEVRNFSQYGDRLGPLIFPLVRRYLQQRGCTVQCTRRCVNAHIRSHCRVSCAFFDGGVLLRATLGARTKSFTVLFLRLGATSETPSRLWYCFNELSGDLRDHRVHRECGRGKPTPHEIRRHVRIIWIT